MAKRKPQDFNFLANGVTPRCCATIRCKNDSSTSKRCSVGAIKGSILCSVHTKARERLDWKRRPWIITLGFKPARRNKDGSYRKTVIGKTFAHKEDADRYLSLIWGSIKSKRKGERFSSACVETFK